MSFWPKYVGTDQDFYENHEVRTCPKLVTWVPCIIETGLLRLGNESTKLKRIEKLSDFERRDKCSVKL